MAPCEVMNRSAARSSSSVVTPGRTFERSIFRQRAWIAPAAAICSICSGLLRMIPPRYIDCYASSSIARVASSLRIWSDTRSGSWSPSTRFSRPWSS